MCYEEFLEESCGGNVQVFRGINAIEEPECANQRMYFWETERLRGEWLVCSPSIGFINWVWWRTHVQGHSDMGPHSDVS